MTVRVASRDDPCPVLAALLLTLAAVPVAGAPELQLAPAQQQDEEASDGVPAPAVAVSPDAGVRFSEDLDDDALVKAFQEEPDALGSVCVGLPEAGRLINAVTMGEDPAWTVVAPDDAWGTAETIDALTRVARAVHDELPQCAPLRINHISKREGGYLRPHQSHQAGRDVDLGFFYPAGVDPRAPKAKRESVMDVQANWELVRALASMSDVEVILVDRHVQAVLLAYARKHGEDAQVLDALFGPGPDALLRHARGHRDHFHVRFYAPRSQELGRRIQPLLALRPEQNVVIHRVQSGETLGGIASRYGSSVKLIQKANGLTSSFLKLGRTLNVPLRGPCTRCPLPPPVVVPPRRVPPKGAVASPS